MAKLIMCIGLPGSGKSTWARQYVLDHGPGVVRVNKDDIRKELGQQGWVWSHENEKQVVEARDLQILGAFKAGAHTVISDDTNFGRRHKVRLEQLARQMGASYETKRFDTPVDECVRRDAERPVGERVGEQVIRGMASKYQLPTGDAVPVVKVVADPKLPKAIICDLDGTLSLFKEKGHRGPYDASKCDQDELNEPIWRILCLYYNYLYQIIYVSGRFEQFRPQTEQFFAKHVVPAGPLYMRADGDMRKDAIVKREIFDREIRGRYHVEVVLDDRDQVVKMWRELGLTCLQVAEGNF